DVVDARQHGAFAPPDPQPVAEVVAHVVAAERQHGERVVAQLADLAFGGGGLLGGDVGSEEDAVLPAQRLGDQRYRGGAAAAEQNRRDRYALGVLPFRGDGGALGGRGGEAGVRVGRRLVAVRGPGPALPVGQVGGRLLGEPFPPDVAVVGE